MYLGPGYQLGQGIISSAIGRKCKGYKEERGQKHIQECDCSPHFRTSNFFRQEDIPACREVRGRGAVYLVESILLGWRTKCLSWWWSRLPLAVFFVSMVKLQENFYHKKAFSSNESFFLICEQLGILNYTMTDFSQMYIYKFLQDTVMMWGTFNRGFKHH